MTYDKVIFLDVDGVLNNSISRYELGYEAFDPIALFHLARIIQETGAKIVISSTWRSIPHNYRLLLAALTKKKIVDNVVGLTPELSLSDERWREIVGWLNQHDVKRFAVIDDLKGAAVPNAPYSFFLTEDESGLTEEIADSVILHLNRN